MSKNDTDMANENPIVPSLQFTHTAPPPAISSVKMSFYIASNIGKNMQTK